MEMADVRRITLLAGLPEALKGHRPQLGDVCRVASPARLRLSGNGKNDSYPTGESRVRLPPITA